MRTAKQSHSPWVGVMSVRIMLDVGSASVVGEAWDVMSAGGGA